MQWFLCSIAAPASELSHGFCMSNVTHMTATKISVATSFSQLRSRLDSFSHLNPLLAGGRLAAGVWLLWMLANMLNKAFAADSGWFGIFLLPFLFRVAANRGPVSATREKIVLQKGILLQMQISNWDFEWEANTQAEIHTFRTTSPYIYSPSSSSIFHSAILGWPRLLEVIKIKINQKKKNLSRIENPFRRRRKLAFCHTPRLEIVHPSSSRWQHQAKDASVLNTNRLFAPLPNGGHFRSLVFPICLHRNVASCLRSNLASLTTPKQQNAPTSFYSRVVTQPSQCADAFPSPHFVYVPIQSKQPGMKNPIWLCVLLRHCQTGSADPDDWKFEFSTPTSGKKPVCCVCHTKWCQMWFICWENASYKSQHASVFVYFFVFCFFFPPLEPKLNVLLHWITSDFIRKDFGPFFTWISRGRSFALRIQRAALDLCLRFLACPGWTTLCKGRHLLHPLKRSGGG